MIRINLLEAPKPKNKRSAMPSMPTMEVGDVGSPRLKVIEAVGLAAAFNLYTWYHLDAQKKTIEQNMAKAEQKNRELADVKVRYLARQREAENAVVEDSHCHSRHSLKLLVGEVSVIDGAHNERQAC